MKAFWIKVINLAVICLILFAYQSVAKSNMKMSAALDEFKEKISELEASRKSAGMYIDGTYEGTGTGYRGDVTVKVTIEDGTITSVEITEGKDDAAYFDKAKELTEVIIDEQTTENVDTVSGATFSSRGILEAVDDALKGAKK